MRSLRSVFGLSSAIFLLSACGASTAPGPEAATPVAEEKVVGPPDVKWADMGPMQKGKFMKAVVLPQMKQLFVEYDAKAFAEFSCATCHGEDAKAKHFEMPNAGIFVLPGDEAGFGKLMQEKPGWLKFMGEKVKPEMAKLLALPEFDPKAPEAGGFSCGNCHTSEKK